MRKTLIGEFDEIYILDLGGNVRKNPKLSGTTHNVFGIQVGVSINLLVRRSGSRQERICKLYYARTDEYWTKEDKYHSLDNVESRNGVEWCQLPTSGSVWLRDGLEADFAEFRPLATEECKAGENDRAIFIKFGRGIETTRDSWLYSFERKPLLEQASALAEVYNSEVRRWLASDRAVSVDDFLLADDSKIKWSSSLKETLQSGKFASTDEQLLRTALYRCLGSA